MNEKKSEAKLHLVFKRSPYCLLASRLKSTHRIAQKSSFQTVLGQQFSGRAQLFCLHLLEMNLSPPNRKINSKNTSKVLHKNTSRVLFYTFDETDKLNLNKKSFYLFSTYNNHLLSKFMTC